jgi:hypothetical protein
MGGAYLGLSDDPEGWHWNPGGAVSLGRRQAAITYIRHVEGIQAGSITYAQPWAAGTAGAFIDYLSTGDVTETDEFGTPRGSFGALDVALGLSYARRLSPAVAAGATVKVIRESISDYRATGIAFDAGLKYSPGIAGLTVGAAVRNLGQKTSALLKEKESMPLLFGLGCAYSPFGDPLTLALDFNKPADNRLNVRLGGEYRIAKPLWLRAGYSSQGSDLKTGSETDLLAGTSFGLGVAWRSLQLDYAFIPFLDLGQSMRFSLSAAR